MQGLSNTSFANFAPWRDAAWEKMSITPRRKAREAGTPRWKGLYYADEAQPAEPDVVSELVEIVGVIIAFLGLGIEASAVLAVTSYTVRRRLPSPFFLQAVGFLVFVAGVAIRVLA